MAVRLSEGACGPLPEDDRHAMESIHRACGMPEPQDHGDRANRNSTHHGENRPSEENRVPGDIGLGGVGVRGKEVMREQGDIHLSPSLTPFADRATGGTIRERHRATGGTIPDRATGGTIRRRNRRQIVCTPSKEATKIVPLVAHRTIGQYKQRPARPSMAARWTRTREADLLEGSAGNGLASCDAAGPRMEARPAPRRREGMR